MILFGRNKGIKILLITFLIFLIGMLILFLLKKKETVKSSVESTLELFNHPIYSRYEFNNDTIINIGIQPMYLPTGIIFELLKRDNILNEYLSTIGKKIEYHPFLKGADVNFFMQQNKLAAGVGGDMPALSISSSFDVIIPVIIQKGKASIVSALPMLTNDLKGKRIAFPYGSISHYFILELLQSAEINEDMVELIPMDVSSMAEALHNHEIDLFSAWEPTVTSSKNQYPDFFIIFQKITTGYLYFSKTFVQKNPEIVNHILAAVIRSISWMKSERKNLILACKWNIIEMEKLTGEKSILNEGEIANLALKDILRYYSKNSIVLNKEDTRINSSLYNEYDFLKVLYSDTEKPGWEQIVKSFDNILINKILNHPIEFHLNDYNYILTEK